MGSRGGCGNEAGPMGSGQRVLVISGLSSPSFMVADHQAYWRDLEEQNVIVATFHAVGAPLTGRRTGLRRANRTDLAPHHVI
jgi:hypothetical protein